MESMILTLLTLSATSLWKGGSRVIICNWLKDRNLCRYYRASRRIDASSFAAGVMHDKHGEDQMLGYQVLL
jgi:hypothetical protein